MRLRKGPDSGRGPWNLQLASQPMTALPKHTIYMRREASICISTVRSTQVVELAACITTNDSPAQAMQLNAARGKHLH